MNNKFNLQTNDLYISRHNTSDKHEDLSHSHCHDRYEILYLTEGCGRCIIEGSAFDIRPSTLILIPPFEYHHVEIFDECAYDRFVIHFKANVLINECLGIIPTLFEEGDGAKYFVSQDITENIASVFDKFYYAENLNEEERPIYLKLVMSELIFIIGRLNRNTIVQEEEELGGKLLRYLNDHLTKELSLDKLAKRFFVSKYYLCRVFKKHNGVSIHGYINQKRVMYAKQLIESGETASGAAYRVGFGDYSAFYRAYVKIVGKSPTAD